MVDNRKTELLSQRVTDDDITGKFRKTGVDVSDWVSFMKEKAVLRQSRKPGTPICSK